jgi:hypothetical protein
MLPTMDQLRALESRITGEFPYRWDERITDEQWTRIYRRKHLVMRMMQRLSSGGYRRVTA